MTEEDQIIEAMARASYKRRIEIAWECGLGEGDPWESLPYDYRCIEVYCARAAYRVLQEREAGK